MWLFWNDCEWVYGLMDLTMVYFDAHACVVCMFTYVRMRLKCVLHVKVFMYVYINVNVCIHMCMYACDHTMIKFYMYVQVCKHALGMFTCILCKCLYIDFVCVCVYIYIYIYTV